MTLIPDNTGQLMALPHAQFSQDTIQHTHSSANQAILSEAAALKYQLGTLLILYGETTCNKVLKTHGQPLHPLPSPLGPTIRHLFSPPFNSPTGESHFHNPLGLLGREPLPR